MRNDNLALSTSEEARLLEKVHASYLRHAGNIFGVMNEVKLPKAYVEKLVAKFQNRDRTEVKRIIADEVMQHLLLGYRCRVQHLMDIIGTLKSYETFMKSTCCSARVRKLDLDIIKDDGTKQEQFECLSCNAITDTYLELPKDTLALKLTALDELRKEDDGMIKFCEKMGYTAKDSKPSITVNQQNNFVSLKNDINEEQVKEIEKLDPVEQETLRRKLELAISEAEIIDDEDIQK